MRWDLRLIMSDSYTKSHSVFHIVLLLKSRTDESTLRIVKKAVIPAAVKHWLLSSIPASNSLELQRKVGTYSLNAGRKPSRYEKTNAAPAERMTADVDFKTADASKITEISHSPTR